MAKQASTPASSKKRSFKALIENPEKKIDIAYIAIPFDGEKEYGTKGQVKVKVTFDGYPYRGLIANRGTGSHVVGLRKDVREAIGKQAGDSVKVTIEKDTEERIVDVPQELQTLLSKNKAAKTLYESLSFTNRKEYAVWISSAKKEETKEKRLKDIVTKLLSGKKNPGEK